MKEITVIELSGEELKDLIAEKFNLKKDTMKIQIDTTGEDLLFTIKGDEIK